MALLTKMGCVFLIMFRLANINFQAARTVTQSLRLRVLSSLYAAVCLYKAYGYFQQKNQKSALNELNKMKKADKAFEEIYETLITKITIPNSENEKGEALS